jgi:hypothetical protein
MIPHHGKKKRNLNPRDPCPPPTGSIYARVVVPGEKHSFYDGLRRGIILLYIFFKLRFLIFEVNFSISFTICSLVQTGPILSSLFIDDKDS